MYIKNAAAAARAGVSPKSLARWDKRYEEVRYPRPVFILGQIYRKLSEIEAWERNNPDFNPRGKKKPPQPRVDAVGADANCPAPKTRTAKLKLGLTDGP